MLRSIHPLHRQIPTLIALATVLVAPDHLANPPSNDLSFVQVTGTSLDALRRNSLAAAWEDYDGNGRPDLFIAADDGGGGELHQNLPGGLVRITTGDAVTSTFQRTAAAWGDWDNDGDPDLFVAADSSSPARLYRNLQGGLLATHIGHPSAHVALSLSAVWLDSDSDGSLDLFVANGGGGRAEANQLYRNNRDGTFTAVDAGILTADSEYSQGATAADYDGDGDLDILVVNLFGPLALYRNEGRGTFVRTTSGEVGASSPVPQGGTSAAWGDYDNDGDLDLVVITGQSRNHLYRNDGGTLVRMETSIISNTGASSAGGAWADLNNDGALDLIIPSRERGALVFVGDGTGNFQRLTVGTLPSLAGGNGVAIADYDLDGDLDVWTSNWGSSTTPRLFRNTATGRHWFKVNLIGEASNRDGIGAKVRLRATIGGRSVTQLRQIGGFDSAGSTTLDAHFGLGDATSIEEIRVEWPSGAVQHVGPTSANQTLTLTEGGGRATPTITRPPQNVMVRSGESAQFSVEATGPGPLSYTWYRDGFQLTAATSATLTIPAASNADVGTYRVVIHTAAGASESQTATLALELNPITAPTILVHPVSQSILEGESVSFSVLASSPVGMTYAWTHNGNPVPNVSGPFLVLNEVTLSQAGRYRAVVTNPGGSTVTEEAVLSVTPGTPATFTQSPESQVVTLGNSARFTVAVNGTQPITVVWYRQGALLPGVVGTELTIPSVSVADLGTYVARASNRFGISESFPATLDAAPGSPPSITAPPRTQTVQLGQSVILRVSATGTPPLTYTWLRNGVLLPSAISSTLTLPSIAETQLGSYTVRVSNGYGSVLSEPAVLSLLAPTPPAITQHPVGGEYTSGATVVLTVGASGSEPLSYIWRRDGELLPGGPYGSQLVLADVRPEQSGFYTVRILNPYGFADATPAVLRITNPPPPSITVQPDDLEVVLGSDVTWLVAAEGAPPLRYQWFAKGEMLANQITPRLSLIAVQLVNEGDYWVRVSNAGGSVTSRMARLKIKGSTPLEGGTVLFVNRITGLIDAPIYLPDGLTRVAGPGFVAQLYGGPSPDSLVPIGDPAPFRDGDAAGYWNAGSGAERGIASVVPGGTAWVEVRAWSLAAGASYELAEESGGLRGTSGRFSLRTGGDGAPPTVPALLTALTSFSLREGLPTSIQSEPKDTEVDYGTPLSLSVTAQGSDLTYQWLRNASPLLGATTARFEIENVDSTHAGDYQVIVRGSLGSITSRVARVTVRVRHQFHLGPDVEVTSGARFSMPLVAITEGGISSGTIGLRFSAQNLIAPAVIWSPTMSNATIRVLTPTEGETRLLFTLPGTSIPAGTQVIAQISFRARTTPTNLITAVQFSAQNLTDTSGRPVPGAVPVHGAAVTIRGLTFGADFNGNDRFDVGDATLLRRLAQGIDSAPSWEIPLRDLDGNLRVEEADAQLMLRMLTGLDPAPVGAVAPMGATESPRFQLTLTQKDDARGRLLIATVRLQRPDATVVGAEFTLEYPVQALRLASATSLRTGSLVPADAISVWNVEPGNQFAAQTGRVHFAASSPTRWPGNDGVLAELTFEVLRGSARRPIWSMDLTASELALDGYRLEPGGLASEDFAGAAAEPPAVTTVAVTGNGEWSMVLRGDPRALYHIEGSSDLRTWTRLDTVATDDAGDASFVDPGSGALAFRFYRVVDAGQ